MESQPRVIHAVLIEVGKNLAGMQRTRRRKQHLVQVCREAKARGVIHRVECASLLIVKGLHAAKMKQSRSGGSATGKACGRDCAGWRHVHEADIRMHLRRFVRGIEERLRKTVDRAWTSESFVK